MKEKISIKMNGKCVSWCYLYTVKLPSRKLAVIEEVFTLEDYRGAGLASKVVKQAIEKAKALSCDCVELNVRQGKDGFYENLGFKDRNNKAMRLVL